MPKKVKVFDDLQESLATALAFEKGEAVDLRVTEMPRRPRSLRPTDIRDIRMSLHANQQLFATFLNVSAKAVQSWEQGERTPSAASLRLLQIMDLKPDAVCEIVGLRNGVNGSPKQ